MHVFALRLKSCYKLHFCHCIIFKNDYIKTNKLITEVIYQCSIMYHFTVVKENKNVFY